MKFRNNFKEGYAARHGVNPKAIFFLRKPAEREFLSKRDFTILCKLDSKKLLKHGPLFWRGIRRAKAHPGIKEGVERALNGGYDGVLFKGVWDNRMWCDVYVVFSNKQIHILGSKKDTALFRKFKSNRSQNYKNRVFLSKIWN